jgi:hypothetical protein
VILDELGYLPFSASGGALLFHLLSKLYERTSVVITVVLRMLWKLPISGLLKRVAGIEIQDSQLTYDVLPFC